MDEKIAMAAEAATIEAIDQGLLIEAGWRGFTAMAMPAAASQVQRDEMRNAFFAGAHHVFASILTLLDEGDEPTASDHRVMERIESELDAFLADFKKRHGIGDEIIAPQKQGQSQ